MTPDELNKLLKNIGAYVIGTLTILSIIFGGLSVFFLSRAEFNKFKDSEFTPSSEQFTETKRVLRLEILQNRSEMLLDITRRLERRVDSEAIQLNKLDPQSREYSQWDDVVRNSNSQLEDVRIRLNAANEEITVLRKKK